MFWKKQQLVTHNATFHADDIFACATLELLLDQGGEGYKVIRTRDAEIIQKGDYVFDVGGEYDESRQRFDHHQKGGAGVRSNGIPYAAFGLVWKTYGAEVCESKEVAELIEKNLVMSIDADDNGMSLVTSTHEIAPKTLQSFLYAFRPSWKEGEDFDTPFLEMVEYAKKYLARKIKVAKDNLQAESLVATAYQASTDKRLLVLPENYPWREFIEKYPELLFTVFPKLDTWRVSAVSLTPNTFERRKDLPLAWAGLRDEDMAAASGVPDAIFCHNGRFLAVAKSKEGALALAQKALEA